MPWRLRLSRLLRRCRCPRGRRVAPAEPAGSGAAAPAASPGQAQPGGDVEEEEGATRSRVLLPCPAPEPHRSGAATLPTGLEELVETVLQDHGYHATSQSWLCPWPLREHSYCRHRLAGDSALWDHQYCHGQRAQRGGMRSPAAPPAAPTRLSLQRRQSPAEPRLQRRKYSAQHSLRRARRLLWRCQHCASTRLDRQCRLGCPRAILLPAKAPDSPTEAPRRVSWPLTDSPAAPPQPRCRGGSCGATSEALCAPTATEVTEEEVPWAGAQREWLTRSPGAGRHGEGHRRVRAGDSDTALRTVHRVPGAMCRSLELGTPSHKDVWPIAISIDS